MRFVRRSLATRLMIWYAASAFILVAGAALIQYRTLVSSLAEEDDRDLAESIATIIRGPGPDGASLPPDASMRLATRTLDEDCRPVQPQREDLPPPACSADPRQIPIFRTWYSPAGEYWRVATAHRVRAGAGWVEVLLNRSTDEGILRAYRARLALVLVAALLATTLLGYGIARRGLRPLARLAVRVGEIDARALERRLSIGDGASAEPAEIEALVASFNGMLARLDRAFRAFSEYTAELAHELRTPIHILRQQAEVALGRARGETDYREALSSSLEELDRMRRMVDDILFLARAEDPRAAVERARLRLATETAGIVDFLHADAAERSVEFVVDIPPDMELTADRMLLRRALVNVISNALRYTPAGGRITISARDGDSASTIEVSDTGSGIPPALLPHVFDRHIRDADSRTRHPEGTGLGLAIVRGIMTLHGGAATVVSPPGDGTRVTLVFPKPAGASPGEHSSTT